MSIAIPRRNKHRLYIALYQRGAQEPDLFHWAILVGPKNEANGVQGSRYHATLEPDPNTPGRLRWIYQETPIPAVQTTTLLGRVMIAKVTDSTRLASILAAVPIMHNEPAWTCRFWVKNALTVLEANGRILGTRMMDWRIIEPMVIGYVWRKRQENRYDGTGSWAPGTVPTFNILKREEITP